MARSDPGRGSTPVDETAADWIRTISLHPPPSTRTITATTPPTIPPAPALTVDNRRSSPAFSARHPSSARSRLSNSSSRTVGAPASVLTNHRVLHLHSPERPADPIHVPVRLVRPSSRVVFASVILVTLPEDNRLSNPGPTITTRDRLITGA